VFAVAWEQALQHFFNRFPGKPEWESGCREWVKSGIEILISGTT
jgi:hypothetical protein